MQGHLDAMSECLDNTLKTTLVSRNVTIGIKRTSVRLEPEMWIALREISNREECTIHDICTLVSLRKKENTSLTAAIRVFLMLYFRASSTEEGHLRAGHGSFDLMKRRARVSDDVSNVFFSKKRVRNQSFLCKKPDYLQEVSTFSTSG